MKKPVNRNIASTASQSSSEIPDLLGSCLDISFVANQIDGECQGFGRGQEGLYVGILRGKRLLVMNALEVGGQLLRKSGRTTESN